MKPQDIHDAIQRFDLGASPELMASRILDILTALNQRMNEIEAGQRRTAEVASCLANGIQPDLYRRASVQAQHNRNQFEQAEKSYTRFCRRERVIATLMFACIVFAVGSILAAIGTAILHAIWK